MRSRTIRALGAGSLACVLALAACGSEEQPGVTEIEDDGGTGSASGSGTATGSGTASGETTPAFGEAEADGVAAVALTEWEVSVEPVAAKGPKTYFEVTNNGENVHELAVTSPGATDEEGAYGEVVDIAPGESKVLALELTPGPYQLACFIVEEEPDGTIEDHYELGMHTEFEVQ